MKIESKSSNVQLLEALNNYYLETNYSPSPVACHLKASDTLFRVLDPNSWNCAICSNDMTTEITEDKLKLCHACFCDIFKVGV